MEYIRKTMDSASLYGLIDIPPAMRDRKVEVLVLLSDGDYSRTQKEKRQLDFITAPPLPDSFFEPLPEEDLQAWGL